MLSITSDVSIELSRPVRLVALRFSVLATPAAVMPMPEAAVDEDRNVPFWQNQVWAAGQVLSMKPESKPQAVQDATDDQLRAGVRAADRTHDLRTPLLGKNVHIYCTW